MWISEPMPVTISVITADSRSKYSAISNRGSPVAISWANVAQAITKETIGRPQPMTDTAFLPSVLPASPLIRKPTSGRRTIRVSACIGQPFRSVYTSGSSVCLRFTSISTIGMAIAISAVATTKIRNTSTAPMVVPDWCANVTRLRLTPLSMSSMHISITSTLRRTITPTMPIANIATASDRRSCALSTIPPACALDHGERSHHGGQQQHRRQFEVQPVLVQERDGELLQAEPGRGAGGTAEQPVHGVHQGPSQQQPADDPGHRERREPALERRVARVEQHDHV